MNKLNIYCDEYDFSALGGAFDGEYNADCPLSAEIVFLDEEAIRGLNARTRGIDRATDVLSFPSLNLACGQKIAAADFPFDKDEEGRLFIGSVAICTQVAQRQAEEYGHSYERELYYLATHGLCHLLGYDHMTDGDKPLMRAREESVLAKLGLEK